MENSSLALALQLQLEEFDTDMLLRSGNETHGTNDEDVALQTQRTEVEQFQREFLDRGSASTSNGGISGTLGLQQPVVENTSKGKRKRSDSPGDANKSRKNKGVVKKRGRSTRANTPTTTTSTELASSSKLQIEQEEPLVKKVCTVCYEEKPDIDIGGLSCGCHYCRDCTIGMLKTAMELESTFPPRCCKQAIQIKDIRDSFLTPALREKFEAKAIEFSTQDRTYCSDPACALFIPPKQVKADVATCSCKHETCTMCKGNTHAGELCPEDEASNEVLALGESNRWKRCYRCGHMVELISGCNHIR